MADALESSHLARWRKHLAKAAQDPRRAGIPPEPPECEVVTVPASQVEIHDCIIAADLIVTGLTPRRDGYVDITVEEHDGVMHVGENEPIQVLRIVAFEPAPFDGRKHAARVQQHVEARKQRASELRGDRG